MNIWHTIFSSICSKWCSFHDGKHCRVPLILNRDDIYALMPYKTWPSVRNPTHITRRCSWVEEHKSSGGGADTPISHRPVCCQTLGSLISSSPQILLQPWARVTRDPCAELLLFVSCFPPGSSWKTVRHTCPISPTTQPWLTAKANEIISDVIYGLHQKGNFSISPSSQ